MPARSGLSLERYWRGSERVGQAASHAQRGLRRDRRGARRRRFEIDNRPTVLAWVSRLSGGLDARTILGTLDHRRNNLATVCMGMAGSRDHEASTELARIVGCKHHNHILDTAFLGEFDRHLENMVRLTDGQYLSQCIVMPTLPLYRRLGIGILMRGHAGELLHMSKAYNYSLTADALGLQSEADLEEWLWTRLQAYMQEGVDGSAVRSRAN